MKDETTELRVIGPPGTGKTSFLAREVVNSVERYGAEKLLIASLTRAAAAEIGGRGLEVPRDHIGTLHAHCYRALGRPALTADHLDEWNEAEAALRLTGEGANVDEPDLEQRSASRGDELAQTYDLLRARMVSRAAWPVSVLDFAGRWEAWKQRQGYFDFTDLIETATRELPYPPGSPRVLMLDEAQDHSRMEMELARRWGQHVERLYVVGDPDQAIFTWRGADPSAFQHPPLPDSQVRVLSQSHRIPRAVHGRAVPWIARVAGRLPVQYRPRDSDGELRRLPRATWKHPEAIITDMQPYLDAGKRVMVLASCGFMLDPYIAILRRSGIPFWNPYRKTNGRWNPLARGTEKRLTAVDRLLAFLRPDPATWGDLAGEWTAGDLRRWVGLVRADGVLHHGAKAAIEHLDAKDTIGVANLARWFTDEALAAAWDIDLGWLASVAAPAKARALGFALCVARAHGGRALREDPKVCVGTIHSTKGGESEVVYLLPDLSHAAFGEWLRPGDGRDATYRLFYVGMTRARETLVICGPSSRLAVQL